MTDCTWVQKTYWKRRSGFEGTPLWQDDADLRRVSVSKDRQLGEIPYLKTYMCDLFQNNYGQAYICLFNQNSYNLLYHNLLQILSILRSITRFCRQTNLDRRDSVILELWWKKLINLLEPFPRTGINSRRKKSASRRPLTRYAYTRCLPRRNFY